MYPEGLEPSCVPGREGQYELCEVRDAISRLVPGGSDHLPSTRDLSSLTPGCGPSGV